MRVRNSRRGRRPRMLFLIGTVLIIALGWFWYAQSRYQYFISTPVNPVNPVESPFVIKKGDTVASIAQRLKEKEFILDEDAFKTYAKQSGIDRKVIAGKFLLNQTLTIPEIAEKITNPDQGELTLTIPEGTTIGGIDERLVGLGVIEPGEFVQATKDFNNYSKYPFLDEEKMRKLPHPLEGFLFPDTYFVDISHYSNQDLIDLMLKTFQSKVPEDIIDNKGVKLTGTDGEAKFVSIYDIVTMASILEKEVKTDADRTIVAGILWKRLEEGWLLGADATLLYLKNDRTIDFQDLQEDSPYNTRKNLGLPPGPIGNPGFANIDASAHPETSPYYFYLTKPGTGEVVYARTNDEHNANKAKYLQ